ncbi:pre-mRNA-splicing factor SPF27-like [Asterias rubens]|uniref:pre-mRNA-splicing factor SPF27-like n=1 Tax=Asterias rubens TaxID=7604 RepID=UPI00145570DD|nr:pre-mRNA-splicing factor SPF27-like [Asterias rubens]
MAGEVLVDALPYHDKGYDEPGEKEAAYALVEEETRRYRPTKNYLEHLPAIDHTPFETDVLKNEFERMASRLPMDVLSMKRYELPPPPAGRQNDVLAWNESVENSMAQLEHQSERIANLELLSKYGSSAWRFYNDILGKMVEQGQDQLTKTRKHIQELNWQRKTKQKSAGEALRNLEESWTGLVGKNYEIERACLELEQEVERLRQEQIIKHAKEEYKTQQMLQHPQEEDEEERVKAEEEEEEEEEEDSDESGEEGGDDVERYRVGSHSSSEEEGDR